ncbi:hypothetical protein [Streptomyces sp. NPDC053427]|uniref:hypothetical protein n=1 Tax=Streptomyces sp. NPDC053427 TaxID=3365701 RepID=UPI0037D972EF
MSLGPPQTQGGSPSTFDPGQETPPLNFGVHGDNGDGAGVIGSSSSPATTSLGPVDAIDSGAGVLGVNIAAQGIGVHGICRRGIGVLGKGGGGAPGVLGEATVGPGLAGVSADGPGVSGSSRQGVGVRGVGGGPDAGVSGTAESGPGLLGTSLQGVGVSGAGGGSSAGVTGTGTAGPGVLGTSISGDGVTAVSQQGHAVSASSVTSAAVSAFCTDHDGVSGLSVNGVGVRARGATALVALGNVGAIIEGNVVITGASQFNGDVQVTGTLTRGGGGFRIDHPLDPENRFLAHSFVESPERKNVYDGTVTLDAEGRATIELPEWFEALNEDFRYQLTALGAPAPELHISREVTDHTFAVAGGGPGQRVSWQVTGVRADVWARGHPLATEEEKAPAERGYFLHPGEHGEPPERGMAAAPSQEP